MRRTGCLAVLFAVFLLQPYSSVSGQAIQYGEELNLTDRGLSIGNIISIYTSKSGYESIKGTGGSKVSIRATSVIVNSDTLSSEKINTRGRPHYSTGERVSAYVSIPLRYSKVLPGRLP